MLGLALLGCVQLPGFGFGTDAVFAVLESESGFAAYGQVRAVDKSCAADEPTSGSGDDVAGLCAALLEIGALGEGSFAGSTSEFDVLSYWFPPVSSPDQLVGAHAAGVTIARCTGDVASADFEFPAATAQIASLDDVAVVELDGEVRGRVRTHVCE